MGNTCRVMVRVSIEGLAYMGKNPTAGVYVCASSATYFAPSAPYVCSATTAATAVGKFLADPATQGVVNRVATRGCELIVKLGEEITDLAIVEGRIATRDMDRKLHEAETVYRALNTAEGIKWLMNYLSGRQGSVSMGF